MGEERASVFSKEGENGSKSVLWLQVSRAESQNARIWGKSSSIGRFGHIPEINII
jgi:hypothetical protein